MKDFKFSDKALSEGAKALAGLKAADAKDEYDPMVRWLGAMRKITDIAIGECPEVEYASAAGAALYIHKNNGQAGLALNVHCLMDSEERIKRDLALACGALLAAKFAEARL